MANLDFWETIYSVCSTVFPDAVIGTCPGAGERPKPELGRFTALCPALSNGLDETTMHTTESDDESDEEEEEDEEEEDEEEEESEEGDENSVWACTTLPVEASEGAVWELVQPPPPPPEGATSKRKRSEKD